MWLLIGYGSSLHSDDGIGQLVAERMKQICSDQDLEIISATQLTPELAEPISRAQAVIFVDASAELYPGEIISIELRSAASKDFSLGHSSLSHHCTPEILLELAIALYGRAPLARLWTVGAANLSLGECLSPTVNVVLPDLIESIKLALDLAPTGLATWPAKCIFEIID